MNTSTNFGYENSALWIMHLWDNLVKMQANAKLITAACWGHSGCPLSYTVHTFMFKSVSPGCDVDVLQQAGEAVSQGNAERPQQVVPAGLHILTGPALGVTLTAHILMVRSHYVGNEVVVTTGCLEGQRVGVSKEKEDSDLSVSTRSTFKCINIIQLYIR